MDNVTFRGEIINYVAERLQFLSDADAEKFKIKIGGQYTDDPWISIDIYDSDIPGGKFSMIMHTKGDEIVLEVVNMTIPKDNGISIPFADPHAFYNAAEEVLKRVNLLYRDKLRLSRKKAKTLNKEIMKTRRFLKVLESRNDS